MLTIRSERVTDYGALAALHYEAFLGKNPFVVEPLIVDLLRHHEAYDPELSIVAELDGKIVGHALFSPFNFVVMGEKQRGVMVAPVAVLPAHQGQRIGAAIMEEGHERAAAKGYALALLCGHSEYYPRFGYLTSVYSLAGSRVTRVAPVVAASAEAVPTMAGPGTIGDWAERPLRPTDLDWINAGWERLHAKDGLALNPGRGLSQWMGHGPGVRTCVLTKDGKPAAYVRYTAGAGELRVRELVLAQGEMAEPLAFLGAQHQATTLHLPFHANRLQLPWAVQIEEVAKAHPPFMVKPLSAEGPIHRYCEQVRSGTLPPSVITFPAVFDIEG